MDVVINTKTGAVTKEESTRLPPTPEEIEASERLLLPSVVSMRQARVYLNSTSILSVVTAEIESIGGDALITWEYSQEVQRSNPLIARMATALGWDDQQLDIMFIEASKL